GGLHIDMLGKEVGHLGLDRLRQQGARPVAQHLGERISERPWLNQLDHVSIGHGVSLLCWRSGGANTPTIRRLHPVSPSPTFAHSSYCKDGKRKATYPNVKFDFLGYCFRPRWVRRLRDNTMFCGFNPAFSAAP